MLLITVIRAVFEGGTLCLFCRHDLIKKLHVLKDSNPDLAQLLLEQVCLNLSVKAVIWLLLVHQIVPV